MRTTQQLSIILPNEMADSVRTEVAAGDRALDSWLLHQVGRAYDALKANPARAVTLEQVRAMLAAEHKKATVLEG